MSALPSRARAQAQTNAQQQQLRGSASAPGWILGGIAVVFGVVAIAVLAVCIDRLRRDYNTRTSRPLLGSKSPQGMLGAGKPPGGGAGGASAGGPGGTSSLGAATASPLELLTDPNGSTVVPGTLVMNDANVPGLQPYVLLEAYLDGQYVPTILSSTYAGLYVPTALSVATSVTLELGLARLPVQCSALRMEYVAGKLVVGTSVLVSRRAPAGHDTTKAIIGMAPTKHADGTYMSPVLNMLANAGKPIAWAYNINADRSFLSFTVPSAPCFRWCWTPLLTSSPTLYAIALQPSPALPWTTAVFAIEQWLSTLPPHVTANTAQDDGGSIGVNTSSGCELILRAGTYTTMSTNTNGGEASPTSSSSEVVFGVSAGLAGGILAFDVTNWRVGHVPVVTPLLTTAVAG